MAIPTSGLFRLYPFDAAILSGEFAVTSVGAPPPATDATTIGNYFRAGIDNPATAPRSRQSVLGGGGVYSPAAGTYELRFNPDTTAVVFDPLGVATPIDWLSADFPVGVVFNQLQLWWNGNILTGPARDIQVASLKLKYFGATILTNVPTPGVNFNGDIISGSSDIVGPFFQWGPNQTFKNFGFEFVISPVVSGLLTEPIVRSDLYFIQGVYNTLLWNITLNTPQAGPGGTVNITDSEDSLDRFASFKIYWLDDDGTALDGGITLAANDIITHTEGELEFRVPLREDIPYAGTRLILYGVAGAGGTLVGEVLLANINILLVDGSGVYNLQEGKRNDTYYDRDTTPISTIDLKIPDPLGRSGFFNG